MEVNMSNQQIVEKFLSCYQQHNYQGMQSCLDDDVHFSDFAFDIHGKKVVAMWHWFCIKYPPREKPIDVPEFKVLEARGDTAVAEYRVNYLYGEDQRPVDYFIKTRFTLRNGKIIDQRDEFFSISEFEFAKMAFGFPKALLGLTPLLRIIVKKKADEKLGQFMREFGSGKRMTVP
jgi:hypothetical protein